VGVIGVGKLGLCLALILEKAGYKVHGYDNNASYGELLRNKMLTSIEPGLTEMLASAKNFVVDDDLSTISKLSTVFCVVATPSLPDGSYDHSAVDAVVTSLQDIHARDGPTGEKLFVVSCTVMPGYSETVSKRLAPFGYHVCYNPEFIAQGDIIHGMSAPDMVLIGGSDKGCELLSAHYKKFLVNDPPIHAMSCVEAEITKISLNCFLTTKIAFANAIGDIVVRAGGTPSKVLNAIGSDTRVGKKFLRWGHGFGGPCLPRDNRALCAFADTLDFKHSIGITTDNSNKLHVHNLADFVVAKNTGNLPFYFDSVVYKKGTAILEESQQLLLALELVKRGAPVVVYAGPEVHRELVRLYGSTFTIVDSAPQDGAATAYFDVATYIC
jgi:UDPglucose 6-dehydrogenase